MISLTFPNDNHLFRKILNGLKTVILFKKEKNMICRWLLIMMDEQKKVVT